MIDAARERAQRLDADMAEAARADHHRPFAGQQVARGFLGRMVGGDTGVGVGRHVLGCERLRQLDQRAHAGLEQLRVAAIGIQSRKRSAAVHVVAAARGQRLAGAGQRMADDRVAALDHLDRAADLLDPARVLVPHDVGQLDGNHGCAIAPRSRGGRCGRRRRRRSARSRQWVFRFSAPALPHSERSRAASELHRSREEPQLSFYETAFRLIFRRRPRAANCRLHPARSRGQQRARPARAPSPRASCRASPARRA